MATYHFVSTNELAQFLRARAIQLDEHLTRQQQQGASLRARNETEIARNAWLSAAAIVADSSIAGARDK